jgi:hypothetical protein
MFYKSFIKKDGLPAQAVLLRGFYLLNRSLSHAAIRPKKARRYAQAL